MASTVTLNGSDGLWKAEVRAFKNYYIVYSSIGTEVKVYRRERYRRWYDPWYKHTHWRSSPADYITISNTYQGSLPSQVPTAAQRSADRENTSTLEEKIWAFGVGVSMDASAGTGFPDPGSASPGGVKLDVRSVQGTATVRMGNEQFTATVTAQ